MDPVAIWEEQVGVALALFVEQTTQWTKACVANLRNAQKKSTPPPPPPSLPLPRPSWAPVVDFASLMTVPPPPPPKEKEELYQQYEEEEENSQELSESSSSSDSFIDDEPESVESSNEEEEDQEDAPPPVHHRAVAPATSKKRARKAPNRYSPSRTSDAKRDDAEAELSGVSLGKRSRRDGADDWNLVRNKSMEAQDRNAWFRSRWGHQLQHVVRAGLGNETKNNEAPRELWDAIGKRPRAFDFRSCFSKETKCAFCGAKRVCTWKSMHAGRNIYMGVCCANLAKAWQAFQMARQDEEESLETMDRLFDCVMNAHMAKNDYYRKSSNK